MNPGENSSMKLISKQLEQVLKMNQELIKEAYHHTKSPYETYFLKAEQVSSATIHILQLLAIPEPEELAIFKI